MRNSANLHQQESRGLSQNAVDEQTSTNLARLKIDVEDIHTLNAAEILTIKEILRHGDTLDTWETPPEWLPYGYSSPQRFDLKRRIISYLPAHIEPLFYCKPEASGAIKLFNDRGFPYSQMNRLIDDAVATAMRYLVLLRMGPSGTGNKKSGQPLAITTVNMVAHQTLPYMLAISISKIAEKTPVWDFYTDFSRGEIKFLSLLETSDIAILTRQRKINVNAEIARMHMLAEIECWTDVPSIQTPLPRKVKIKGPAPEFIEEYKREMHLPLPDDYVSKLGQRSIWLLENLGPSLLSLVESFPSIWAASETLGWSPGNIEIRRRELVEKAIAGHAWIDCQGARISGAPFPLALCKLGHKAGQQTPPAWPPRRFSEVMHLLLTVQMAHVFIVAMSMAGRTSETLSLKRNCLHSTVDGDMTAIGRTYKLVRRHGGEERDWVLPDIGGRAIEQQLRLIKISEQIQKLRPAEIRSENDVAADKRESTEHLWGQVITLGQSDPKLPLEGLPAALQRYALTIGLPVNPGGQPLRPHRIRKTVARLVALAITQAPKILMDVFGHKSIEMTLYYILSDKDLRTEIETISRELRVVRAKDVIRHIVDAEDRELPSVKSEGYGGMAALAISRAIQIDRSKHHQMGEEWGANSIESLAETLTLQGKAWQLVRPGIICTKFPGTEVGPCNLKKGAPEPSRCQATCSHRLEEGFLRQDVDASIQIAVKAFEAADRDGDDLLKFHWAGQIRANISRFSDLKEKWIKLALVESIISQY